MATTLPAPGTAPIRARVGFSSFIGTALEYYDFILYGTAAALVFNKVFFANFTLLVGSVLALATLAAGFVARLGGAVLFGHYGDRLGRRNVMLTTMATMGIATGLIGLLPDYGRIGAAAPVALLVLRIVQGVAVGGEYGGAVLMTAEHARPGRRGLASSAAVAGAPCGAILSSAALALVTLLPEDQLLSWGWRIPFLFSFLLVGVGLYFRLRVPESPAFLASARPAGATAAAPARPPIVELFRTRSGLLAKAVAVQLGVTVGQGVFTLFGVSYARSVGYPPSVVLLALLVASVGALALTPVYAALSDRVGRRRVVLAGSIGVALWAYPGFVLIDLGNPVLFVISVAGFVILVATAVNAVVPVLLSELYPTEIRFTGVSMSYQLAQTLGSGFAPLIAASLLALAGGGTHVGLVVALVVVAALLSVVTILRLPETRDRQLVEYATSAPVPARDPEHSPFARDRSPAGPRSGSDAYHEPDGMRENVDEQRK